MKQCPLVVILRNWDQPRSVGVICLRSGVHPVDCTEHHNAQISLIHSVINDMYCTYMYVFVYVEMTLSPLNYYTDGAT